MKHTLKITAAGLLALSLAGCTQPAAGSGSASSAATSSVQDSSASSEQALTMGEVMKAEADTTMSSCTEKYFVYVSEKDGKPVRYIAEITKDIYDQIDAVSVSDPLREEKIAEIVAGLKVTRTDDLSSQIPTQEELDALKGEKGQKLLDEGFTVEGIGFDEENNPTFVVQNGVYELNIVSEEGVDTSENPDASALFAGCTIKSAEYVTLTWDVMDPEKNTGNK